VSSCLQTARPTLDRFSVPMIVRPHLQAEGYFVRRDDLAQLSPYQTRRLKRFGDYTLSMSSPEPFDTDLVVPFPLEDTQESAATA
jgi:hypothetical protein